MKTKFLTSVFFTLLFSVFALGQTPMIKLCFTGVDNFQHVHLDKIQIKNLDKNCDTTLFWPDTTLSLKTMGINEMFYPGGLQVFQNTPNPVQERTSIKISVPERGIVRIQVTDLLGRNINSLNQELGKGTHVFVFTPEGKQVYFFTAIFKQEIRTIKIIADTKSDATESSLIYQGIQSGNMIGKSSFSIENFLFSLGDSLEMIGYYGDVTAIIKDNPTTGKTYTFTFLSNSPIVTTSAITNITLNTATSGGNVTSEGGTFVTAKGVCWSTLSSPTINDNKTLDGGGMGGFMSFLTDLSNNTTYYVRAYAINSIGISYGLQKEFTTLPEITIPSLITAPVSNTTNVSAQSGGTVTNDGGATIVDRGVCWSTVNNPTIIDQHTSDGTGTSSFISQLTNLTPITFYYVRAYATNSAGTAYGNQQTFSTLQNPIAPVVTTALVINITTINATSGGNVASDGGVAVTARGVCWSTSPSPTTSSSHTSDGNGTGIFVSSLTGLSPGTLYYIRAYATNSVGTSYGNEISFNTLNTATLPTVTTDAATTITQTTATCGGNVPSDGGAAVTIRGVCWSTNLNPTTNDNKTTDGSGTGTFISYLTGLNVNIQYYVRAYATNSVGTAYGNEVTFTTLANPVLPILSTTAITNITTTTATSGGNITSDGGASVTLRGTCWSTSSNPTIINSHTTDGSGTGIFISYLTGLTPNTLYYVRAYATNSVGTGYGNEVIFTSGQAVTSPIVTTTTVTNIAQTTAASGGTVTSDGGTLVTARGVCWSISPNPTTANSFTNDGTGTGTFTSNLTGLTPNTLYYLRAYATNSVGTAYGNEVSFTTLPTWSCGSAITINHTAGSIAPVTKTVTYGTVTNIPGEPSKCWITSNLGSDHQAISVSDATEASAGWYWQFNRKQGYKHDGTTRTPNTAWIAPISENSNWTSANDPCTIELGSNWRIPTSTEWDNVDASGNWTTWNGPWNSNLKLHTAGFLYNSSGMLNNRGSDGYYWSNTQYISPYGYLLTFIYNSCGVGYDHKESGNSLRCLQDSPSPTLPTVTTTTISNIAQTTATSGGNITSDGGASVTLRGICWSTSSNPTITNSHTTDGSGTGIFISYLTGLTPNTPYYVRAYATNSVGTAYGNEVSCMTLSTWSCGSSITINHVAGSVAPVTKIVTYGTVTNIPGETSKCWITSNLGADHQATAVDDATEASAGWYWQFNRKQGYKHDGTTRTPNSSWISSINETSDWTTANDACNIELGAAWRIPTYTEWYNVDNIGGWTTWTGPWSSGLKLHAAGLLNGSSGWLSYRGSSGNYWSSTQSGTTSGWGPYFSNGNSLVGSDDKTTGFSIRCIKDNSPFTCGDVLPYDGKNYTTVQIGTQCWFKENLNVGTKINGVQNQSDNGIKEKYCINDLESNCTTYGGLYQWNEMMQYLTSQGTQGLCPNDWHIPTDAEWAILTSFLGGEPIAGGKMKETGTLHWMTPNTGATNSSGFTALPGAGRESSGFFYNISTGTNIWSSTQSDATYSWVRFLNYFSEDVSRGYSYKTYGFSVRCLKN
ncbi:MAG: FISUMP domain-containing protein [bacterium]